jgi:hypothetical protein
MNKSETMHGVRTIRMPVVIAVAVPIALGGACSASSGGSDSQSAGNEAVAYVPAADPVQDGNGHTLKTFVRLTDPGAGGFVFSISGEVNAITGYPYPPVDTSQTWMVDGWSWKIEKYIVVVDRITLWSNPNVSASDQSQHGPQVAHVDGPFVVDLHKGGPLDGKGGGGEQALAIAVLTRQNDSGGAPFDLATTYGLGFSTVVAPSDGSAINVNLDASEQADYEYMVRGGYSVYYSGVATWAGDAAGAPGDFAMCTQTSTAAASNDDGGAAESGVGDAATPSGPYDFTKLPRTMAFQLGFATPTNYVNCVNYSVSQQVGTTVRGVQPSPSQSSIEQLTLHMDHPFWESFAENSPVHWDQIAAQYIGVANPVAHTEDMIGVSFAPFTDKNGAVMPWRDCEAMEYTPPGNGAMTFSTLSVPQDPHGTCTGSVGQDFSKDDCPAIRDYYDFLRYTQSTQGHLNSQGQCFVDRQYPAPAGGS